MILISSILSGLLIIVSASPVFAESSPEIPKAQQYFEVSKIIDGDTFLLNNQERVRLIGVDAPELINSPKLHRDARKLGVPSAAIKDMGREARKFLANLIEGKKVRFEYEGSKRDRNGRLLAYVYLEDGSFINAEVLRQGYGTLIAEPGKPQLEYAGAFYLMQNEAIAHDRGLWGFLNHRIDQLFTEQYQSLSPAQRKAVLDYIDQLRSGRASESYTPVNTPGVSPAAETSAQKTEFPKTSPV